MLADRVGIIDHGRIVAEGTPQALKARDRPLERRGHPRRPGRPRARSRPCWRASASPPPRRRRAWRCGCARRRRALGRGRARARRRGPRVAHLQLHAPSLDDVFLAKTGRSLEGAEEAARPRGGRPRRERDETLGRSASIARRSVRRTLRQPALIVPTIVFPLLLLAVNASGLDARRTSPASRPTPTWTSRSSVTFMQGGLFAAIDRRHRAGRRHRDRLPQPAALTPLRAPGDAGRPAGRRAGRGVHRVGRLPRGRPDGRRATSRPGVGGALVLIALAMLRRARVRRRSARSSARAPARPRRCRACSRCCSSSSSCRR